MFLQQASYTPSFGGLGLMRESIVARSVLHYTNKERAKRGLPKLAGHRALSRAARWHSEWMAHTGQFSHQGEKGSSPSDRAKDAGYDAGAGENIWAGPAQHGQTSRTKRAFHWHNEWTLGKAAVISLMGSPGHRANILQPSYREIGIGVARDKPGRAYVTQDFGAGKFGRSFLLRMLTLRLGIFVAFVGVALAAYLLSGLADVVWRLIDLIRYSWGL